jgi:hypothetical protein
VLPAWAPVARSAVAHARTRLRMTAIAGGKKRDRVYGARALKCRLARTVCVFGTVGNILLNTWSTQYGHVETCFETWSTLFGYDPLYFSNSVSGLVLNIWYRIPFDQSELCFSRIPPTATTHRAVRSVRNP